MKWRLVAMPNRHRQSPFWVAAAQTGPTTAADELSERIATMFLSTLDLHRVGCWQAAGVVAAPGRAAATCFEFLFGECISLLRARVSLLSEHVSCGQLPLQVVQTPL
jgi:hypothetical protein